MCLALTSFSPFIPTLDLQGPGRGVLTLEGHLTGEGWLDSKNGSRWLDGWPSSPIPGDLTLDLASPLVSLLRQNYQPRSGLHPALHLFLCRKQEGGVLHRKRNRSLPVTRGVSWLPPRGLSAASAVLSSSLTCVRVRHTPAFSC